MATREIPKVKTSKREKLGSRYAARLREQGLLPVVIYGHETQPVHVTVNRRELTDLLHANARLVEAQLDTGSSEPCLIKDVQWDHLGSTILHIDLTRVDLSERVQVEVAVQLTGDAIGLKEVGAILEHPVTEMMIECVVTDIPEVIKVDVTNLGVGDTISAKDVKLPQGVSLAVNPDLILASITTVKEVVVETPVEGAAAEPEVIGKKVEEGEAAAEGGDKAKAAPAGDKAKK